MAYLTGPKESRTLTYDDLEVLRALLHLAETPGDFTDEEVEDVLGDAGRILYAPTDAEDIQQVGL